MGRTCFFPSSARGNRANDVCRFARTMRIRGYREGLATQPHHAAIAFFFLGIFAYDQHLCIALIIPSASLTRL
eukprot:6161466-Pyramimonas_sp.AAC.1